MISPEIVSNEPGKEKSILNQTVVFPCRGLDLKTRASETGNPIYLAPEGEKIIYERIAYGYYYDWDIFSFGRREGGINITYGTDGYAYIHNPISGWATNTYMKGELKDGKIEVELPQVIYMENDFENPGEKILFYAAVMNCKNAGTNFATYEVVEENATYIINEDGSINLNIGLNENLAEPDEFPYSDKILGLCDDRGNLYFGDAAQFLYKKELTPIVPPSDLTLDNWLLYVNGEAHEIQLGVQGNDVYLGNFDDIYTPDTWIKGKKDGNLISFESGQFLEETNGFLYHFLAATNSGREYTINPEIVFSYDEEKTLMTTGADYCMVANPILSSISFNYPEFMSYKDPVLKWVTETPASNIPLDPHFYAYLDYTSWAGMYFCEFDIYTASIYFDPIPESQLFFRLFVNGDEIEEFSSYPPSYDFPYGYFGEDPDYMSILQLGTNVVMYLYFEGCESLGMQLINKTPDGTIYESAIVTYDVATDTVSTDYNAGVGTVSTAEIISSEYYDLNGMKLNSPKPGINIKRNTHSDGTVSVKKIFLR